MHQITLGKFNTYTLLLPQLHRKIDWRHLRNDFSSINLKVCEPFQNVSHSNHLKCLPIQKLYAPHKTQPNKPNKTGEIE